MQIYKHMKERTNCNVILVPKTITLRKKANGNNDFSINIMHNKLTIKFSIIETEFRVNRLN
jgi:hypothetical protein